MCQFFEVSRSGYYEFIKRVGQPAQDTELAAQIRQCQKMTDHTYGYRRVWLWLKNRKIHKNPKTILRVMKKYGLLSEIRRHRKWVNLGQQMHKYENLLKRRFRADKPNAAELHPTVKPQELVTYLMRNSSRPGEIVLDPFGGSGSTLIACQQLNRTCYTMELDPHYADVIIQRYIDFMGTDSEVKLLNP
jgi:DNA modification methylase